MLRTVVAGSGAALVAIALWQMVADTSLAALTAAIGSDATQWALVIAFGCALIVAARISGTSSGPDW